MKFRILLPLLLCAVLTVLCSCGHQSADQSADPSAETHNGTDNDMQTEAAAEPETAPPDPNLLFEDNFDGDALDSSKWEKCPEWERQSGLDVWDNDMSFLDGEGHLILRAEWNAGEGRIHSGAVRTAGKFSEAYAYYEASIRFTGTPGIWGAFWLMAGNVAGEDNGAADGVEIDIIESIGSQWDQSNSALHWDGYGERHSSVSKGYDAEIYDGQFHTFGLWRTEEAYIFYIDDKEVWRVAGDRCAICPEKGYMKLTVEGADWAGAGTEESINALPADMTVDYVRVYREKP